MSKNELSIISSQDKIELFNNAVLRSSGLTEEEIKTNSLRIFEHIRNPEDKIKVVSILRILDMLPVMEQIFLDEMIDMLTAQNLFRQSLKLNLKKVSKLLETVNNDIWRNCDKSGENSKESQESWYINMYDFCEKFSNAIRNYVINIEALTNVSESLEENKRNDYILSKAKMISQLKENDIFIFLDLSEYCEYTYIETNKDTSDYKFFYKKYVDDNSKEYIPFYTDNPFRPVMVTNVLDDNYKNEIIEILKKNK